MKFGSDDMFVFGGAALLLGLIGVLIVQQGQPAAATSRTTIPIIETPIAVGDHLLQQQYATATANAPAQMPMSAGEVFPYPNGVSL